jgi:hypothetical protein
MEVSMFSKAKLNFVVDVMILIAFIAATLSGLILMTMLHGRSQGGRNPALNQTVLLLTRHEWNDLHASASLAMIAGIVVHLALHWRWIVCMVRRLVRSSVPTPVPPANPQPCEVAVTSRRD